MSVIFVEHRENGELADAERVHLSDQDSTFGIKRLSDGQIVIAADTPVNRVSLGRYEFNIDLLSPLFDYVYVFQIQTRNEENEIYLEYVQGFIPSQEQPIGDIPESQPPDYTPSPPIDTGLQQEGGQFYKPGTESAVYFDGTKDLPATGGDRTNRSWQEAYGYGYGGPSKDDGFWDGISYEDMCVIPITPRGQCMKDRSAAIVRAQLKDTDPSCVIAGTLIEGDHCAHRIEDIVTGQKLLTHNLENNVIALDTVHKTVEQQPKDGKIVTIKTKRGREIQCTTDHPCITRRGKVSASNLTEDDQLLVNPMASKYVLEDEEEYTILSVEDYVSKVANKFYDGDDSYPLKQADELKQKGLLPLTNKNKHIRLLVRIVGWIFGDGSIPRSSGRPERCIFAGGPGELEDLHVDLQCLPFKPKSIKERQATGIVNGVRRGKYVVDGITRSFTIDSTAFALYMYLLGAPFGNKAKQHYMISQWIFDSKNLLREFLASYYQCDGRGVVTERSTGGQIEITFNKVKELHEQTVKFTQQLIDAFAVFDIKMRYRIDVADGAMHKDGQVTQKYVITCDESWRDALIKFVDQIGLRYHCKKYNNFGLMCEYQREIKQIVNAESTMRDYALKLIEQGATRMEATDQLIEQFAVIALRKMVWSKVDRWHKGGKASYDKNRTISFDDWQKKYCDGKQIYDEILTIKTEESDVKTYDVMMKDIHIISFNGQWSHNCWAFSEDEIDMYLESALSDFNATPMFTRFQWHDLEDRWLHIISLGAQVFALFAQGLIEVGREFVITDNGISFQPPPISSHFQSTASTLLAHYQQNKELIKGNMKPTPSAVGVFTVLAINPMLTRLRHLRERRIV